jgi:hypothetical protein
LSHKVCTKINNKKKNKSLRVLNQTEDDYLKNKTNLIFVKTQSLESLNKRKKTSYIPLPIITNKGRCNTFINLNNDSERIEKKIENFEFINESHTRDLINDFKDTKLRLIKNHNEKNKYTDKISNGERKDDGLGNSNSRMNLKMGIFQDRALQSSDSNLITNFLNSNFYNSSENQNLIPYLRTSLLFGSNEKYFESCKFLNNPIIKQKIKQYSHTNLEIKNEKCKKHFNRIKKIKIDFPDNHIKQKANKIINDPNNKTLIIFIDPNNLANWNIK